jgi:hypothetical protein
MMERRLEKDGDIILAKLPIYLIYIMLELMLSKEFQNMYK